MNYCPVCGWWTDCEHQALLITYWCATCDREVADCPHH